MRTILSLCLIVLIAPALFADTVLFTDEFGAGSASNYTITKTGDDTSIQFGFDASSAGIANAPNGDNIVLRTAVNIVSPAAVEAVNAYLDGGSISLPANYTVQVDVYLAYPYGGSGTTEHAGVGLFGSGTKINSLRAYTPLPSDTDGLAFGYNSDDDEIFSAFFLTEGSATGQTDVGTWAGSDPTPGGQRYPEYAALFSIPTNADGNQLFGNQWATIAVSYMNGMVTCKINGDTYVTYTPSGSPSGKIFLLHTDPFSSVASDANASFCLFDHLVITEPPAEQAAKNWEVYQ